METFNGIRARNKDTSKAQADGYDSKCKDETVTVKLWAFLSRLFNMKQKKGSQVFMILCLSLTSTLSWYYLSNRAASSAATADLEEAYHREMSERVRHKMATSQHLEPEDHDWMRSVGLSVHHAPATNIHLPPGDSLHIAIMMPFLDHYPLSAAHYISMLEWITIYSSVRIHFHVITNEESQDYVDQVMEKVNATSNCNYDYEMLYFDQMIDYARENICPDTAQSEEYCDMLIGRVTPLLFPWLFPSLAYILYVDKHIIFHDDVGKLYNEFLHMDEDESIGMVQEQTLKYMRAFGSYHIKSPSTKLGRPPSKGNPGFNPDLMVMDLVKLRADTSYKSMIHELKISLLLKKYSMHLDEELPDLGEILNLMAAEKPAMFHKLSCEWNKSAMNGYDPLSTEFLDCLPESKTTTLSKTKIRATNKNPNHKK